MYNLYVENFVFGGFTKDNTWEGSLLDNSEELFPLVREKPGHIGVFAANKKNI